MRYLRYTVLAFVCAGLCLVGPARADSPLRYVPLGYCQITVLTAAVSLVTASCSSGAVPSNASMAIITTETQGVRWRDDGTAPTATIGMPLAAGGSMSYSGTFSAIQFIQQSATATLDVAFYR